MLAPIVCFVYNQLKHTQNIIEDLKKADLSSESELFIFSDGGKDKKSWKKVHDVRKYL